MWIETMEDFKSVEDKLPESVKQDICKRMDDWISSGGSSDDAYFKQQFRYAERVLERLG